MNVKQIVIFSIVIAALVFIVTVALQYLGKGTQTGPIPPPPVVEFPLTFSEKTYPTGPDGAGAAIINEVYKSDSHDFWFHNSSGKPVQIGLVRKSCTCTQVDLCVLPEERWKGVSEDKLSELAQKDSNLEWRPVKIATEDPKGLSVPAGGGGWIRLGWNGPAKAADQKFTLTLWAQAEGSGVADVELAVLLKFVDPIYCQEEESIFGSSDPTKTPPRPEEKRLGKIDGEAKASFLCWSLTRPSLTIKPEKPNSLCVAVGEPIKLGAKEKKKLASALNAPVQCVYRVPVTVRERIEDTQLDLGLFRYRIGLDTDGGPKHLFVIGEVDGPVALQTEDGGNIVDVGKFRVGEDKEFEVRLATIDKTLKLKLDTERNKANPFLQAKTPEETSQSAGKSWRIEVMIPSGSIEGKFPDREKPGFQDCALYLSIYRAGEEDKPWRRIRVPIIGEATAR